MFARSFFLLVFMVGVLVQSSGCRSLFGWDIHAPGLLSGLYFQETTTAPQRIALYLTDELTSFTSTNKGGRFADPQTYHVGEAFTPMVVEAFQHGFEEFLLMEAEPTPAIMNQYAIPYLVALRPKVFDNRVTLKGQAVGLRTEALVFNPNLDIVGRFEVDGSSDAKKVFAKKGGPEVNLNAAIENNISVTVETLQDWLAGVAV